MLILMRPRTSQPRRQRHDFCRHPASYVAGLVSVELHTYQTLAMLKKRAASRELGWLLRRAANHMQDSHECADDIC